MAGLNPSHYNMDLGHRCEDTTMGYKVAVVGATGAVGTSTYSREKEEGRELE